MEKFSHSPLVSVIIPAFNAEKYIEQTIESVIDQTYQEIEIIVVDDGSTDNTVNLVENYKGVRLISQKNSGVGVARNNGARNSTGKYLAFIDADDMWKRNKIEEQVRVINKYPEVDVVTTDRINIDDKGNELLCEPKINIPLDTPFQPKKVLLKEGNPLCWSSCLILKEKFNLVGGFNKKGLSLDYDLWIRMANIDATFYTISKKLTMYRNLEESMIHGSLEKEFGAQFSILSYHRSQYNPFSFMRRKSKIYYDWADKGFWGEEEGKWKAALKSLIYNPFQIKIYWLVLKNFIKSIIR